MKDSDFSKNPYKQQTFETYALWKSLPSFLKGQPKAALEKFGINEDALFDIFTIRTQSDFAKKYSIDSGTLSDWNKRLEKDGNMNNMYSWARKFTPNIVFALAKNAMRTGNPHAVRAWFELIENN